MPKFEIKDPEYKNLGQRKAGGSYYLRKFITGRGEILVSLRTNNRNKAVRAMNLELAHWLSTKRTGSNITVDDVVDELLEAYQKKAHATYESFEIHRRLYILPYFNGWRIEEMAKATAIKAYVHHYEEATPGRKLGHDIRHIKRILNYAVEQGYIDAVPRYKADKKHTVAAPGREYSNAELTMILKALDERHRFQAAIMIWTGCRPGEARQLRYSFIDFEHGIVTLPSWLTKTRTERSYGVPPQLLRKLTEMRRDAKGDCVFPSKADPNRAETKSQKPWQRAEDKINEALRKKGKPATFKVRPHWFRHTYATKAVRGGAETSLITKSMGLGREVLERVYLHPSQDDKKAIAAIVSDSLPKVKLG